MKILLACATLLVLAGTAWWASRSPAQEPAPYPRWRNGIIVAVRNCNAPASEDARVRCAALYCAQRVTVLLTNAQQAKLALDRYERDPADGLIHVTGSLDQYLRAPTLPTGFTCTMRDFRHAEPEFVFSRRAQALTN